MEAKAEKYRKDIIRKMKNVGTYDTSFEYTIATLATVMADYEKTNEQYNTTGRNVLIRHTNKSGATNYVRNPLCIELERQRDDIITYSKELGLTPTGLKRIKQDGNPQPVKMSKLDEVMEALRGE